jgi:hypothetical protein
MKMDYNRCISFIMVKMNIHGWTSSMNFELNYLINKNYWAFELLAQMWYCLKHQKI